MNDSNKLISLIKDIDFTMLTTVASDGSLHSRPMATLEIKDFNDVLYFFSRKNSEKNHCIEEDQNVNLAYSDPEKHHYVSVYGTANIQDSKEKIKEFWKDEFKTWFPDGINDVQLSLIEVRVEGADIWERDRHSHYKTDNQRLMTPDEKVDQYIDESFPASDPPAHTMKSAEDLKQY